MTSPSNYFFQIQIQLKITIRERMAFLTPSFFLVSLFSQYILLIQNRPSKVGSIVTGWCSQKKNSLIVLLNYR